MSQRKLFAQYYSPGTFFAETSDRELTSTSIEEAVVEATKIAKEIVERHNAKPYAFDIMTKIVVDPVSDGEGGTINVPPKEVERSCRHHLGGQLMSYGEMSVEEGQDSIAVKNMRGNDIPLCIVNTNSFKSTQPFEESDVCVDVETGEIVLRGDATDLVRYRKEKIEQWKAEREERMKKWQEEQA